MVVECQALRWVKPEHPSNLAKADLRPRRRQRGLSYNEYPRGSTQKVHSHREEKLLRKDSEHFEFGLETMEVQ